MGETPNNEPAAAEHEPPRMTLTLGIMFAQGSAVILLLVALAGVIIALN